ncbi:uncharacterized protein [Apostichopus japonicus]|uniref:uncharacterized protein isoform X4 n=1 Tax=Stichopus japonicus TaxID=307972 RepID=UPI003AB8D16D
MATPASRVSLLAVLLTVIVSLEISSTYAQIFACDTLGVTGLTAQPNANSPYEIQIAPQFYTAGTVITVTVHANQPAGRNLRELICQARDTNTNALVGTFTQVNGNPLLPTNEYNVYNCGTQTTSSVGTTNSNLKNTPVVLTYQAAAPATGNIEFRCSFLQDTGILYQSLTSQQVVDQATVAGPVINNCPGDIFLPLSQASMTSLPFVFVEWTAPTSIGVAGANNPVNPNTFTQLGTAAMQMTYTFTSGGITATCSFNIVVNDDETTANNAPVLSGCPVGTVNSFTTSPTCNDAEQGTLTVNCNPAAGSNFQAGTTTTVTCSCSDNLGASDVCNFNVFVATANNAPVLSGCPVGTVNSFTTSPTCNDAEQGTLTVNCNPAAGSTFQAGTTTPVTCFCSDNLGASDFCNFNVFVAAANNAPVLSGCPVGTVNSFTTSPTCNDAEQGTLTVNCNPAAGSTFQAGTTTPVTCVCSDNLGASDFCNFNVFVAANNAPVLSGCPVGTVNSFTTSPTCNDAEQGTLTVNCNPPAGSTFQAGTTTPVTCFCSDNLGSSDFCNFNVFVATANNAPVLSGCPVGTVNSFTTSPTCNDAEQGTLTVNCNPAAGSTFQAGTTTPVTCFCSDNLGSSDFCNFNVFVAAANNAPVLSGCPVGTVNSFTTSPTCNDAEQGTLTVNCNPAAGSTFQAGTTTPVTCFCSDNLGASDFCNFNVFVAAANNAPVLSGCPVGTVNSFTTSPTCNDAEQGGLAVTCNPPAGSTFQAGTTTPVTCVCSDNLGSSDFCNFNVFVAAANNAPVLSGCPVGTVNSFTTSPTCNDAEQGGLAVTCNPPAGSTFQAGTTTPVTCVCSDNLGSSDFCNFNVFVVVAANTAPTFQSCPDVTANAPPGSGSTDVSYTLPFCIDTQDIFVISTCNPPSGTTFPVGSTDVTCVCTDSGLLSTSCTFQVQVNFVVANTAPAFQSCPDVTVNAPPGSGSANAFYTLPVCTDTQDGFVTSSCTLPSGTTFPVGSTDVTCVCTDSGLLSTSCTFQVQVNFVAANTAPTFQSCPDVTVNAPPGSGSANAFYTLPVCTDTQDGFVTSSCTLPSGTTFPVGSTDVTCVCTDSGFLSTSCTFQVQVNSVNSPPQIGSCPTDFTTIPNGNQFFVQFTTPSCSDPDGNAVTVTCNPATGSTVANFPGVITCICTDSSQASDSVACPVNQPPTVQCPADFSVTAPPLSTSTTAPFNTPQCVDNQQANFLATCTPSSGSPFNAGSNTVVCTCTDSGGLTDSCTFVVTVLTVNSPPQIGPCPTDFNSVAFNNQFFLQFTTPSCTDPNGDAVTVTCNPGAGSTVANVPGVITCTCTDSSQATDSVACPVNQPPTVQCPADFSVTAPLLGTSTTAQFNTPQCVDSQQANFLATCTPSSGSPFNAGSNTVVCTCTDSGGLTDSCTFTITVQIPNAPPQIGSCPTDFTTIPNGNQFFVQFTTPSCTDPNGDAVTVTCNPGAGSTVANFPGVITCICTDSSQASDSVACPVNQPPTVQCPADFSVTAPPLSTSTTAPFNTPQCVDNQQANFLATCTPSSGSPFNAGSNTVACTCTDSGGLTGSCTFVVTVLTVNSPPQIGPCPTDFNSVAFNNQFFLQFTTPSCTDPNGDAVTVTCNPGAGSIVANFPGVITCTCTDSSQAIDSVTCPVNQPPTVQCPADFSVTTPLLGTSTTAQFNTPQCVDSQQANFLATCTPSSGSPFNAGSNTVVCTCQDSGGLTDSCTFTITVQIPNSPPQIGSCPTDFTTSPNGNQFFVQFTTPSCTDPNGDAVTVTCNPGAGSTVANFPGVITCTCTDSSQATSSVACPVNQPPTVQCPADFSVTAPPLSTSTTAPFNTPQCVDNQQANFLATCTPSTGSPFNAGSNTVVCTCTDSGGLTGSCTFVVNVLTVNSPPQIGPCPTDFSSVAFNNQFFLQFTTPSCTDPNGDAVTVTCNPGAGSTVANVPGVITCTCTDSSQATDSVACPVNQPPTVQCPADFSVTAPLLGTSTTAQFNTPQCVDNQQANFLATCTPSSGSPFNAGSNTVVCTCTDSGGLTDSCSFTITVQIPNAPPQIGSCPTDFTTIPNGNQFFLQFTTPSCTDPNGDAVTVTCNPGAGSTVANFPGVITCTCTDSSQATDSVACPVNQPPTVQCPADFSVTAPPLSTSTTAPFNTPQCVDNQQANFLATCTPSSGSPFNAGSNTVVCTCQDSGGLTGSCTFVVNVLTVNSPPQIGSCPTDFNSFAFNNQFFLQFTTPSCTDPNGDAVTVTCNPAASSTVANFPDVITCTCTDSSQATSVVSCPVNQPPTVQCPADFSVTAPLLGTSTTAQFNSPQCVDNQQANFLATCTPSSGSPFNAGSNTVVCTCTDSGGLTDSCTFTINVQIPNSPPQIGSCPTDFTTIPSGNQFFLQFTTPSCTDPNGDAVTVTCNPATGSTVANFPGVITCTCTDSSQATDSVACPVNQPPTVQCPADFSVTAPPLSTSTTAPFNTPQCVDNQQANFLAICTPSSGSPFNAGSNTVVCTCQDSGGLTDSCTFVVTVLTVNSPPQIGPCPTDFNSVAFNNQFFLQFTTPSCTDPNGDAVTVTCNPGAGSTVANFPGVITCTCTDSSQATDSVTCPVNQPPTVQCPADFSVTAQPLSTSTTAPFNTPQCVDNQQANFLATCTPSSGSSFNAGPNTVACTCTDSGGLTDTCTFTISVIIPNSPPQIGSCPTDFTTFPSGNQFFLQFTTPSCTDPNGDAVTVTCNPATGSTVANFPGVITCTCTDSSQATDSVACPVNQPPTVQCPADFSVTAQPLSTSTTAPFNTPQCVDNQQANFLATCSPSSGSPLNAGSNTVACTCTDSGGLTGSCTFTISVIIPNSPPQIGSCPTDFTTIPNGNQFFLQFTTPSCTDPNGDAVTVTCNPGAGSTVANFPGVITCTCTDSSQATDSVACPVNQPPTVQCPADFSVTAQPLSTSTTAPFNTPQCVDNQQANFLATCTPSSGSPFNAGSNTVVCTCQDSGGLTDSCTFTINVQIPNSPPQIGSCPTDFTTFPSGNQFFLQFTTPSCTDPNGDAVTVTCNPATGSTVANFPGVITCTCTDSSQATDSVACPVNQPPTVQCPADFSVTAQPLSTSTIAQFNTPQCVDNQQANFLATCTPSSGSPFNAGSNTVACTCTDSGGLTDSCTFTINVQIPNSPPQIGSCPTDFTTFPSGNQIFIQFTTPSCTDPNGDAVTVTCNPATGSTVANFPGVITCTCTDSSQATDSVACPVDTQPPTIVVCPSDQVVTVLTGSSGGVVNFPTPQAQDNSGFVSVVNNPQFYSGFYFPLGMTTVTYVFSDAVPLTVTCTFTITVNTASPCDSNPCFNGGVCLAVDNNQFWCVCPDCFIGETCSFSQDPCTNNNQCQNGGQCRVYPGSCTQTFCDCPPCFTGANCQISSNPCDNNQCGNGGVCVPSTTDCDCYSCLCSGCRSGPFCEVEFDPCSRFPCLNGGACTNIAESCASYSCQCTGCFTGYNCQTLIPDPCVASPCLNGGICQRVAGTCFGYTCSCQTGFGGVLCENNVAVVKNPCNTFPCMNDGCCVSLGNNNYKCICRNGYTGILCGEITSNVIINSDSCRNNPCTNGGTCYNSYNSNTNNVVFVPQYTCACQPGFVGQNCQFPVANFPQFDICTSTGVFCLNGGTCRNTFCSATNDLGVFCECPAGFLGERCQIQDVNRCSSSPCRNGGQCTAFSKFFVCSCAQGFGGTTCEVTGADNQAPVISNCPTQGVTVTANAGDDFAFVTWPDLIVNDNSGHVNLVSSNGAPGNYPVGSRNIQYVYADASGLSATCSFVVTVNPAAFNPCNPNPCQNNAFCSVNGNSFQCACVGGFTGPTCTVPPQGNPCTNVVCQNGGTCTSNGATFTCQCFVTFTGTFCEVPVTNPCSGSPCLNDGACTVFGNNFQCTCVGGFSGNVCQTPPVNPCTNVVCQNGGTCITNGVIFTCQCLATFTGTFCEVPVNNPCSGSPCLNGGTCTAFGNTFQCTCVAGFSGTNCQTPEAGNQAPSEPNCPTEQIVVTAPTGSTSAVATFTTPTCMDAEQGTLFASCDPASDTSFPLGATSVTCTCQDNEGLQSECLFIVQVNEAVTQTFAECPGQVTETQVGNGMVRVSFTNPVCPAGQVSSCTAANNALVTSTNPVDVCCTCSSGQSQSQCCFARVFDPQSQQSFFVTSVSFPDPYPQGMTYNTVVTSTVNLEATLLFFMVPPPDNNLADRLSIGAGGVIGNNVLNTYDTSGSSGEIVIGGNTLWISFVSTSENALAGRGFVFQIEEAIPMGRKRRSIGANVTETEWKYSAAALTDLLLKFNKS